MSGLEMRYFVLKPAGDDQYAASSRKAMRAYALGIQHENPELADQLRDWAQREYEKTQAAQEQEILAKATGKEK